MCRGTGLAAYGQSIPAPRSRSPPASRGSSRTSAPAGNGTSVRAPGEAREHVLEPAERSLACDRDIEQLPQLGVGDGPDEFLHVAVALVRVLRLDGQEPAGRVLLDLLDRQRQLFFVLLTEAEHHPRFGVEHPGEFAALILER